MWGNYIYIFFQPLPLPVVHVAVKGPKGQEYTVTQLDHQTEQYFRYCENFFHENNHPVKKQVLQRHNKIVQISRISSPLEAMHFVMAAVVMLLAPLRPAD